MKGKTKEVLQMEIIDEKTENDEGIDSFDSFTEENDEESSDVYSTPQAKN